MEVVVQPDKDNKVWFVLDTIDDMFLDKLLHRKIPMNIHSFETRENE